MTKDCPITINNELVTVCKFDEVLVQFPSIHDNKAKTVKASFKNGRYTIVDNEKEKPVEVHDEPAEAEEK